VTAPEDLFPGPGGKAKAHRLFFALRPDEPGRGAVAARIESIRGRFPDARWVRAQRWHLTLHYLGESDRRRDDLVARAVAAAGGLRACGFAQPLDRLRAMGNPRRPALALAAEAAAPDFSAFWNALRQRLLRAGFRQPAGYLPHLTVAYLVSPTELPPVAPVSLRFDAFHLFQSVEGQAEYDVLGSWPLPQGAVSPGEMGCG
jgi:2'-5' RNA ligase